MMVLLEKEMYVSAEHVTSCFRVVGFALDSENKISCTIAQVLKFVFCCSRNAIRITKYNPATKKGNRSEFIGSMEKDFEFAQLRNNKVTFVKSICKSFELAVTDDMKSVTEFLATLA